tara:strand:- start:30 stop:623 length:594 start_codon:yes stop_codon:yes gene_type:complete
MTLPEKIKKYGLTQKDWYQHKHYTIITRMGIDKIQAIENISIHFDAVKVEPEFCVVKATGVKDTLTVQTFGSSKYGAKEWVKFDTPDQYGKTGKWAEKGNTTTWYIMEMAEKRAMSRVVLKITGFYELGVFGEDESEDFNKPETEQSTTLKVEERKESLKDSQYNAVVVSKNKEHVQYFLDNFKMSDDQRTELTKLK